MSTTRLPELLPLDPAPSMKLSQFRKGERAVSVMACENYARLYARAYGLAVWKAAMERAGEIANQRAEQVRKANTHRGRLSDAAIFCIDQCEQIGMEIRALPLPEQGSPQERRE